MLQIQTILHPTDFSTRSEYAFKLACSLARDHGARLVILHVGTPPPVATYGEVITEPDLGAYRDHLWTLLSEIRASDKAIKVEHRLEVGFAAEEILRTAGEIQADLIVMGTHGRTGVGRLLLGSVAEVIVRKACCPVLTVKAPAAAAATEEEQNSPALAP